MKKENFSLPLSDKIEIPEMCYNCGEDDFRILKRFEKHHIFAKSNSNETILLCPNCHGKITSKQNSISPKQRKNKFAYKQLSQGRILELIGLELQKDGLRLLENGKDFS